MIDIIKKERRRTLLIFVIEIVLTIAGYICVAVLDIDLFELLGENYGYFFTSLGVFFLIQVIFSIISFSVIEKKMRLNYINIASTLGADISESYEFAGIGLISYDENYDIIWTNDLFEKRGLKLVGLNIRSWQSELIHLFSNESEEVILELRGCVYTVRILQDLKVFIFKDITDYARLEKVHEENALVIMQIIIDNYQDIASGDGENEILESLALARNTIFEYADRFSILLKRNRNDGFLAFMSENTYQKIYADRFSILENIKKTGELTLSLGIGRGTAEYVKLGDLASTAIDVCLSRGGDQVVINTFGQSLEFIGGSSESRTSNNKVKVRVLAKSLATHISTCKNVLIMGHINSDFDSLGSCFGVLAFCQSLKIPAKIVYEDKLTEAKTKNAFRSLMSKNEISNVTVTSSQALNLVSKDTLLVMVDNHRPSLSMVPALLEAVDKVAIIDHHRRSEEFVDLPIYTYIEPSSSSASELVAEMIKYSPHPIDLPPDYATLMLSGILLDTNNYRRQTDVRTFDASMILKEYGADITQAIDFLKDEYEEFIIKNKILSNAFTAHYGVVVTPAPEEDILTRAVLAKVAQDGINIKGINAMFVIGRTGEKEVAISARSDSTINVQLLMEKMGGGGHFSSAAVQFNDKNIEVVKEELLKTLDQYLEQARGK